MSTKDFNTPLLNLDDTPIQEAYTTKDASGNEVTKQRDLLANHAVIASLENPLPGDEKLSMKQLFSNMELADRIHKDGETKLSSEEKTMVKERVAKAWPRPIVLYRITQLLED